MARFDLRDFKKQASFFLREKLNDARLALTDVSRIQLLTEEATNEDSWGPETRTMAVLADAAFELGEYERIIQVIHSRLEVSKRRPWRQLYKTLVVLEHLLTHGPKSLGREFRGDSNCLEELSHYSFTDQQGIDRGLMVRKTADRVLKLINNPDFRSEERTRARKISSEIRGFGSSSSQEPSQNGVHGAPGQSWQTQDMMQLSASSSDNSPEETGNADIDVRHLEDKHVLYEKNLSMSIRSAQEAMAPFPHWKGKVETRLFKKSLSSPGYLRDRLPCFSQQPGDEIVSKLKEEHTSLLDAVEERETSYDQLEEGSKEIHMLMSWPSGVSTDEGSTEDGTRVALSENTYSRSETTDRFFLAESCKLSMQWYGGERPSLDLLNGEAHPKLRAKCQHQWQPPSLITCDSKFGKAA